MGGGRRVWMVDMSVDGKVESNGWKGVVGVGLKWGGSGLHRL